jgi:outer membrane protein
MIQQSQTKILLYCFLMCVLTGATVIWMVNRNEKKIAVVDAVKLFDSYNMKKELEEIAKNQLQTESKQLDSVSNALNMAKATNKGDDEVKKLAYSYNYLKSKLENDYTQSNHDINEKIWKRLNPLLNEFGKMNQLHLVIGANGMGSVLYNDAFYDRTEEVIKFVNKRYAEGN